VLGLVSLAGCGFAPVYGTGTALRGRVAFSTDETVAGFRMHERLEQRLGTPLAAKYLLQVTQTNSTRPAAVTAVGYTVRFNIVGKARWTLRDLATDTPVGNGDVQNFTSYSATGSTVATQSAATDASARLSMALADMIVARLMVLAPDLTE